MRTDHEVEESRTLSVARRARTLHQSRSVEEESEEALLSREAAQLRRRRNRKWLIKSVTVHWIVTRYLDNCSNSRANTCSRAPSALSGAGRALLLDSSPRSPDRRSDRS
ncbi:hypothetical protein TNCV_3875251 [Trichonephila clavipes]|uniref:Uncharacterized protein n=1 Tax=Trichonephila clavipes TaxID=2585209 RepID=A0A8X6T0G0_TRICX|nr:hypothetical protein TNCV_3875251 [Trichonephila clavipes]